MNDKRAEKLVDQAFLRPLDHRERERLERHLMAYQESGERYRKIQLAQRVIAAPSASPEELLEEPSPAEIERIAQGLGLFEEAPRERASMFGWWPMGLSAAALALVGVFALGPYVGGLGSRPDPGLVARGGAVEISFSTYIIRAKGGIEAARDGASLRPEDHLKLRVSWPKEQTPIRGLWLVFVPEKGAPWVRALEAPKPSSEAVSIPGAIALRRASAGPLSVFILSSEQPLPKASVLQHAAALPGAAEQLGASVKQLRFKMMESSP